MSKRILSNIAIKTLRVVEKNMRQRSFILLNNIKYINNIIF